MSLPILLGYQQRWVMDRSRVKVCLKSRQVGITWATGYEAVEVAAAPRSSGGRNVWFQSYEEDSAKEFLVDAARWARVMGMLCSEIYEEDASEHLLLADGENSVMALSIRFASQHRVTALASPPRKLRGKGGLFILDEADSHDDLVGSLEAASAFLTWGGRVAVISTQGDVDGTFCQLVEDIKAGRGARATYSLHVITLLDAVREGLYRRICEVEGSTWSAEAEREWVDTMLATEGADTEFMCVPRRSGGQYIPRDVVQACMTRDYPVVRFTAEEGFLLKPEEHRTRVLDQWCRDVLGPLLGKLPPNKPHYLGEDFGRSSDMTVLAPGFEAQDLVLEVPFIVELANVPYEAQRVIAFYVISRLPRFAGASFDATGNGGYLAEAALAQWGEARIEAVSMSEKWYGENLPKLRARFQDGAIRLPSDLDVLQDLGQFQVINGIPKLPKIRVNSKAAQASKSKRHGDAGVALACLVHAVASRPAMNYKYEPVPRRGGHFAQTGIL